MEGQLYCGYCTEPLNVSLDEHLPSCEKEPWWARRRRQMAEQVRVGLEREGWDTPPDAA